MIRCYTSGVIVGRLVAGEAGTVVLEKWRFLRRWKGAGIKGSVYHLVHSDQVPSERGPLEAKPAVFQQADLIQISEEAYERLAND